MTPAELHELRRVYTEATANPHLRPAQVRLERAVRDHLGELLDVAERARRSVPRREPTND